MRYPLWIVLPVLLLPVFAAAQSAACAPLSRGSSGPQVTALQTFLYDEYAEFPTPTGYFGAITEAAVKQWQSEKGIVSSGSPASTGWGAAGPKTMLAMGLCSGNSPAADASLPPSAGNPNTTSGTDATQALIKALTAQVALLLKQITELKTASTPTAVGATTPPPATANTTTNPSSVVATQPQTQTQTQTQTPTASTPLAACSWQGSTIGNGGWVSAYQSAVVPTGSQCVNETRICSNGVFSGSYTAPTCTVGNPTNAAPLSCQFAGGTLPDGFSVLAYQNYNVPSGSSCVSESRMCTNGSLSGSYAYSTCSVANAVPVSYASCSLNGTPVPHGGSATAYQTASAPSGGSCVSESRTCTNGTLSGSYQNTSCSVSGVAFCTFNGSTVLNGASVTAYQTASVAYGASCTSQSRTCTNGVLSGTYTNSSCAVATGASCTLGGQSIPHGASVAAFQNTTVNSNSSCNSQTRTCTNGAFSGSSAYAYNNCTVTSNNASLPNMFVPLTYNGRGIQLHGWFATPGGSGPYPVIVIAHGCSGLNPDDNGSDWAHENTWAQTFRGWGYATLIVDSFTARGVSGGVCGNSDYISPLDRSADLYSAATVLAKMSTINPQKIGMFGTSHGANAAAWSIRSGQSATQTSQSALTAAGGKISASAGLYPNCDSALSGNTFYSPLFFAIGASDNESNSSTCKSLTNFPTVSGTSVDVNGFGSLVRVIVYPNIGHRFDVPNSGEYSSSVTNDVQSKIKTFFDSYLK